MKFLLHGSLNKSPYTAEQGNLKEIWLQGKPKFICWPQQRKIYEGNSKVRFPISSC
jgi:hypothetical protein